MPLLKPGTKWIAVYRTPDVRPMRDAINPTHPGPSVKEIRRAGTLKEMGDVLRKLLRTYSPEQLLLGYTEDGQTLKMRWCPKDIEAGNQERA